jgi:hypothetical protein
MANGFTLNFTVDDGCLPKRQNHQKYCTENIERFEKIK